MGFFDPFPPEERFPHFTDDQLATWMRNDLVKYQNQPGFGNVAAAAKEAITRLERNAAR